jgi:hypothetical protein
MGDAVAIIAVATSGTVGLAGILTTSYGTVSSLRWRSREERVAELRAVLDTAAAHIAAAMQAAAEANRQLSSVRLERTPQPVGEAHVKKAREQLDAAVAAEKELWVATNRIRVRTGSTAVVAEALKDAERQVGLLVALVGRKMIEFTLEGYEEAWGKAEAAERAFYDAAAQNLRVPGRRQRVRRRSVASD